MKKKNYPLFCVVVMMAIIVVVCVIIARKWLISSEKQKENEGPVTIHTTSGEVLGYYGNVKINNDGTNGQADIELSDSWLVGSDTEDEEKTSSDPEPLVIDIPEPATTGKFTIYEPDGSIHFQYVGDFFKVMNDGSNGEDVEICVYLPVDGTCSCFKDGESDGQ